MSDVNTNNPNNTPQRLILIRDVFTQPSPPSISDIPEDTVAADTFDFAMLQAEGGLGDW